MKIIKRQRQTEKPTTDKPEKTVCEFYIIKDGVPSCKFWTLSDKKNCGGDIQHCLDL